MSLNDISHRVLIDEIKLDRLLGASTHVYQLLSDGTFYGLKQEDLIKFGEAILDVQTDAGRTLKSRSTGVKDLG